MARLTRMQVTNYRSIGTPPVELLFPINTPVVLIGENNAGKSNLVRGLHLALGSMWPGTHEPEDNEFFLRNRATPIEILLEFAESDLLGGRYDKLIWKYDPGPEGGPPATEPVCFRGGPGRFGGVDGYVRNEDRDTCVCVLLEADRNLEYHLGYSSKYTMLSRLMHRFHKALVQDATARTELEGLFAQTKAAFAKIPEFAQFTGTLTTQLNDLITSMTHRLEVSFEAYNPVNFFQALRLQADEGGEARALSEMGTGEKQVLAMAFAYAYAQAFHGGIILAVEEPEAHLHPLAQRWLARKLRDMAHGGLQVLLTTHSPEFVNLLDFEGLALVRKSSGTTGSIQRARSELVTYCQHTGATGATVANILPFYAAQATHDILEGFFAKTIVLVEGPTEALALPIYLERVGLHCAKEGVAVTSVGGKGQLGKWHRLFSVYEFPLYVVFDNDPKNDAKASRREDVLRALEIESADQPAYLDAKVLHVGDSCAVFGVDFEATMRAMFPTYAELEKQAHAAGIDPESKPLVARWVAERLPFDSEADGWKQIADLSNRIRIIAGLSAAPAAVAVTTEGEEEDDEIPF